MKKFFSKLGKFLAGRIFISCLLIIGIACLALYFIFPSKGYDFKSFDDIYTGYFYDAALSQDGSRAAVYDSSNRLYVIDRNDSNRIIYCLEPGKMGYGKARFLGLVFDEKNRLYLHLDNASAEYILLIDENGKQIGQAAYYDYSDKENYYGIEGINYYDGAVHYIFVDENADNISVITCDNASSKQTTEWTAELDGYEIINSFDLSIKGEVTAITVDGYSGKITEDGFYIYSQADFDVLENETGILPFTVSSTAADNMYLISGLSKQKLIFIDDEKTETIVLCDELYEYTENPMFSGLYSTPKGIAFSIEDSLYISNENGSFDELDTMKLSFFESLFEHVKDYLLWVAIPLLALAVVLIIGNLMHWHFSILTKQLFVILPVVIAANVLMSFMMVRIVEKNYYNDIKKELINIGSIVAAQVDGDKVAKATSYEYVEDGYYYELTDYLSTIAGSGGSFTDIFALSIYRQGSEGRNYLLADTVGSTPLNGIDTFVMEEMDQYLEEGTNTYILKLFSSTTEYLTSITEIQDSDGNVVGYVDISADMEDCDDLIDEITGKLILATSILIATLALAIFIICYINIRYLKKASAMIQTIAGGDFTAHIDSAPSDEVGNICRGVNDMATQLQTYFIEKDRNEQFYYKFVPEKFKELLHKNEFTELTLGDAESLDLTVLFCDIRSFSLNSEMMTARENFEFVNTLYGIAGPIIRKYDGFVDKYIGDAVMALFESADAAIKAGIELYNTIVLDPSCAKEMGMSSINIGVGIHSGMARIGIVGEDERMSGTVISNTVNISSRLESLTKQYKTAMIITKDTLDRMEDPDSLSLRYLGMVQVAGVNEVKALYEVLDCLAPTEREVRENTVATFREAVKQYHLGNAIEAHKLMSEIVEAGSTDPVPEKYADYINGKIKSGDKEHNIFKFDKK